MALQLEPAEQVHAEFNTTLLFQMACASFTWFGDQENFPSPRGFLKSCLEKVYFPMLSSGLIQWHMRTPESKEYSSDLESTGPDSSLAFF